MLYSARLFLTIVGINLLLLPSSFILWNNDANLFSEHGLIENLTVFFTTLIFLYYFFYLRRYFGIFPLFIIFLIIIRELGLRNEMMSDNKFMYLSYFFIIATIIFFSDFLIRYIKYSFIILFSNRYLVFIALLSILQAVASRIFEIMEVLYLEEMLELNVIMLVYVGVIIARKTVKMEQEEARLEEARLKESRNAK